ncbi:MAG: hypothetical protein IJF92_05180 [Bacilli bacterium]|nr:hypothetical protein [Bacilli bacterium]
MKFRTNKDNKNYLMVNIEKVDELLSIVVSNNIEVPENIREEAMHIIRLSSSHNMNQLNNPNSIKEVALNKSSNIGQFLINNTDFINIINEDDYIYYKDVVHALNIAMFEDNCKLSNRISRLFREQTSGTKQNLYEQYGKDIIDYIKEHNDFNTYLLKFNGIYEPRNYFVYEDNNIVEKKLYEKEKTLIRK